LERPEKQVPEIMLILTLLPQNHLPASGFLSSRGLMWQAGSRMRDVKKKRLSLFAGAVFVRRSLAGSSVPARLTLRK
jgi:hypothetical protein